MKEAQLYSRDGIYAVCGLCAHRCRLRENQTGICGVRKNIGGALYSLNYHRICATHVDPVEKKPLYHFLPGTASFSLAAMGCNFRCRFCQNHTLSMVAGEQDVYGENISPESLVHLALQNGCHSISYTYSEPTVFFELMSDTARLAQQAGLKNVMVTNGFMTAEGIAALAPFMDAANIDLKSFSDDFYINMCGGRLEPVLDNIRAMKGCGIWVELTTLLIPGLNTAEEEIKRLTAFIAATDVNMPWHVSRFFPQHRLQNLPPTPVSEIHQALEAGAENGLLYLYAGNVSGDQFSHTVCPRCKTTLIERRGYATRLTALENGKCTACGFTIAGVF